MTSQAPTNPNAREPLSANGGALRVLPLDLAEYATASAIVDRSIRASCLAHYPPEVVEVWIDHNGPNCIAQRSAKQEDYLARMNDEPAAYLGIKQNEIGHLFVDPAWAGRGIGRALVAFSEAAFRKRGHTGALVFASLNAWGFYEKLGYRRTGEGAFEIAPGIRLGYVRMEKVL